MKKNLLLLIVFVVLAIAAYFVYLKKNGSTIADEPLTDFAIADTASITKLFLTDKKGNSVLLERTPGQLWTLNGKYKARKDAIDLVLETIYRIRVRGMVSNASRDNMMKVLAAGGKKVEIYQNGNDEPSKIYYVGSSTPDHFGTIMLLEIPEIGRSEEPYITHMEGFTGFLTPRFFTDEMEWRYTGYYSYPELNFSEVQIIDNYVPENSLKVEYHGGNDIALYGGYQPGLDAFTGRVNDFDSIAVKDLLLLFKKVHFDSYNTLLKASAMDSIDKVIPAYTIKVKESNGQYKDLLLYNKRAAKTHRDEEGNILPWDMNFYWAKTQDGEYALAQKFVFNPILFPLKYYVKPNI